MRLHNVILLHLPTKTLKKQRQTVIYSDAILLIFIRISCESVVYIQENRKIYLRQGEFMNYISNITLNDMTAIWSKYQGTEVLAEQDCRNLWLKIKDFFTGRDSTTIV